MFVDSDRKSVFSRYPRKYPGESNPYQKFRKLLFYPLNYKGSFLQMYAFFRDKQYFCIRIFNRLFLYDKIFRFYFDF